MNRIKELRKSAKLSQEELAEKFGVERATISRWENQKHDPSIADLVRLADYFNVTVDYLLGKTNDPVPHLGKSGAVLAAHRENPFADVTDEEARMIEAVLSAYRSDPKNRK